MEKDRPLVAIQCITYNHEPYISDTLEGFVMQKTKFPFVAIVHDDASTDGTADIIRKYAEKYPDIIKPIFETENQYSKRDGSITRIMNEACIKTGAKYIAFCEGDDYWTDPLKLQKQVNFLEANPKYVYTCHNYTIINSNGDVIGQSQSPIKLKNDELGFEFTKEDAFRLTWFTKTLTCVFPSNILEQIDLEKYNEPRDTHLVYEILNHGKGYYFNFLGGNYRVHKSGVCSMVPAKIKILKALEIWEDIYKKSPSRIAKENLITTYCLYLICHFKRYKSFNFPKSKYKYQSMAYLPIFIVKLGLKKISRLLKFKSKVIE